MTPQLTLRPSQWTNIGWVLVGVGLYFLILPPFIAIYKIIEVYCTRYDFYDDLVTIRTGVFSVDRREVGYHRMKSIRVEEPFLYRFVGIGNVHVVTSDRYADEVLFNAIPGTKVFVDELRDAVDYHREKKGLKELDLFDL